MQKCPQLDSNQRTLWFMASVLTPEPLSRPDMSPVVVMELVLWKLLNVPQVIVAQVPLLPEWCLAFICLPVFIWEFSNSWFKLHTLYISKAHQCLNVSIIGKLSGCAFFFPPVDFADFPSPAFSRLKHAEGSAATGLPSGPPGHQLSSDPTTQRQPRFLSPFPSLAYWLSMAWCRHAWPVWWCIQHWEGSPPAQTGCR